MRTAKFHIPDSRGKLYEKFAYPAGEIQTRLTPEGIASLKNAEGFEIEANPIPDIMELAQLADAIRRSGTFSYRRLFLPYMPFARADRQFVPGDTVGFVAFMELVTAMGFTSVWTFDAHNIEMAKTWGICNVMPTDAPTDQIGPIIKQLGKKGLVIVLPDEGAAKRYHKELKKYDSIVMVASKVREPKTGKLTGFKIGAGIKYYKKALIIDDICDGGGTFIGQAQAIHKKNPGCEISLYVSHGIFSKGTGVIYDGGIKNIYVSDYSIRGNEWDLFDKIGG